jgi:hypothetical protein
MEKRYVINEGAFGAASSAESDRECLDLLRRFQTRSILDARQYVSAHRDGPDSNRLT